MRHIPVYLTYFLTKIVMGCTVYYIYPHIGTMELKIILFVFFMLIEVTYVAATFSKPVYLNDVDILRPNIDTESKICQLLKRYDASEICPYCELVMRNQSRHCHRCNKCIMDFDRHVNVLNNCVNGGNRMSYILFLGTLFCFLLSLIAISIVHFDKVQFSPKPAAIPED